jgi:membrane protease YdiL (CAAX protease family)
MVFRARVLRTDERAIGLGRALIRNAFKMVSLVTLGLASLLCILFSKRSQRVGDMVAGTVVIRHATGLDARVSPHTGAGAAPAALELVRHRGQLNAADDPGRVRGEAGLNPIPWGAREAVLGFVVAQFPEIVPALLTLLAGITAASSMPTTARAIAAVVGTMVFDSWWVAWAWVFSLRKFRLELSAWGFRRPGLSILWLTPLAVFAAIVVDLAYTRFVTVSQNHLVSQFPHTTAGLVLLVIGACVLAPLFEETFFRGFLFQGLAAWRGAFWGAVISSTLWSAVHMQSAVLLPLFVNGLLLCWVFRRGRSIWTNIAVHATINAIAVLAWVH